jgi:hypothetical protein
MSHHHSDGHINSIHPMHGGTHCDSSYYCLLLEIASSSNHWDTGHYKKNHYNPGNGTQHQTQMYSLNGLDINGLATTNKDKELTNILKIELG